MDFINNLSQQSKGFFGKLSANQKALFGVVGLAVFVAILWLTFTSTSYELLFSNLNPQDANAIVKKLQEKSIPYKLEESETAIYVPKESVYELRLSMAGDGVLSSSVVGYEIFDRQSIGVSDQVQKSNMRRALEGELTRTILQIQNIQAARVHIVLPEKRLFSEDQKQSTASVWLKTKSPLSEEVSQGIAHLVASSVEGLEASNVKIFDQRGVIRSSIRQSSTVSGMIATNVDLQRTVEKQYVDKIQGMLDAQFGPMNSYTEVSVEMDFRQNNKTQEVFDPEDQVVRSEQITEQNNFSADTSTTAARNNKGTSVSTITNYEIGKTIENTVSNGGDIKKITISVSVNGRYEDSIDAQGNAVVDEDDNSIKVYIPKTSEELYSIGELVKKAVGFSDERKDEIAVIGMRFFATGDELTEKEEGKVEFWKWCMEKLKDPSSYLMLILMVFSLFFLWRLSRRIHFNKELEAAVALQASVKKSRTRAEVLAGVQAAVGGISMTQVEEVNEEEKRAQDETREKVKTFFKEKPDDAANLLKGLVNEGE